MRSTVLRASSRLHAGDDVSYQDNVDKLMAELARVGALTPSSARPVPHRRDGRLARRSSTERRRCCRGLHRTCPGGRWWFRHDPVFVPAEGDGRTFAEMGDDKHESAIEAGPSGLSPRRSHRGPIVIEGRQRGWVLAALGMLLVSTDSYFVRLADIDGWTMAFLVSVVSLRSTGPPEVVEGGDVVGAFRLAARACHGRDPFRGQPGLLHHRDHTHRRANVVVIVAASPIIAAVVGRVFFGERTNCRTWTRSASPSAVW